MYRMVEIVYVSKNTKLFYYPKLSPCDRKLVCCEQNSRIRTEQQKWHRGQRGIFSERLRTQKESSWNLQWARMAYSFGRFTFTFYSSKQAKAQEAFRKFQEEYQCGCVSLFTTKYTVEIFFHQIWCIIAA